MVIYALLGLRKRPHVLPIEINKGAGRKNPRPTEKPEPTKSFRKINLSFHNLMTISL